MKTPSLSRRTFLKHSAVATATVALHRSAFAAEDYGARSIPIGLQLYTIGGDVRTKGHEVGLAAVAKAGYKGVEFAGYYNLEAAALKKLLDDNGLKCCGAHVGLNMLVGDNFTKTVEFHKAIGNTRLIAPSLGREHTKDKESLEKVADQFNEIAAKLKPLGLRTGFHCHPGEFKKIDGETIWDIFFTRTTKDVIMQCDFGHMGTAGVDPVEYLKKYPGRASTVHVKPSGKEGGRGRLVGGEGDNLKWAEIFKACETVGGTEWYIVEYDGGSLEMAEKTIAILKGWGKTS